MVRWFERALLSDAGTSGRGLLGVLCLLWVPAVLPAPTPAADNQSQAQVPPTLTLTLTPHAAGAGLDYIDAALRIEHRTFHQGDTLLRMPLVVASIPTQRYDGDALKAVDDQGTLGLRQKDAEPTSFGTNRDWILSRDTIGSVTARFRIIPRAVDANTRSGPLFDVRAEGGGINGSGMTFVPTPTDKEKYQLAIHWDLSSLPRGDRAVSCYGDGDASWVATADALAECYYAVGPLHVFPEGNAKDRRFGIYWLTDPTFEVTRLASQIQTLFKYMSTFFHDQGGSYRVFIRKNPYDSGGGTALHRSFMFGWSAQSPPTVERLEDLLAHEMTHNWPELSGEHGETSWYAEGNAEYYSVLLSWRSGAINADEFLKRINARAAGYYQNPLQTLSNQEAEERYWQDPNASYVPYGRGWMYLAKTDAEIREHSHGKRSLDDIVVALAERNMRGENPTVANWVELVTRELGPQARTEFEDMVNGRRMAPPPNAFAPCFKLEEYQTRLTELGFDEKSMSGPKKIVSGLIPGSNAALAGLKDGDEIVHRSRPDQDEPNRQVVLTIVRNGVQQDIRYDPLGSNVQAYRWSRVPGIADTRCRY